MDMARMFGMLSWIYMLAEPSTWLWFVTKGKWRFILVLSLAPQFLNAITTSFPVGLRRVLTKGSRVCRLLVVRGCDGSTLLDDAPDITTDKNLGGHNRSAGGYEVIDTIKSILECACPNIGRPRQLDHRRLSCHRNAAFARHELHQTETEFCRCWPQWNGSHCSLRYITMYLRCVPPTETSFWKSPS